MTSQPSFSQGRRSPSFERARSDRRYFPVKKTEDQECDRAISRWPAVVPYCTRRNAWVLPGGRLVRDEQEARQWAEHLCDLMWHNMEQRPEIFRAP